MQLPTTQPQTRAEFLRSLGMSSAALMSFYCMGTLTACSSGSDDAPAPQPPGGTAINPGQTVSGLVGNNDTSKGAIDFTLTLTDSNFSALKTDGEFKHVGDVIVARVQGGSYVALSKECTHQGTPVEYRLSQNDFRCPNHGSEFSTTGTVQVGPASRALTVFTTSLSADGNQLRVRA